MFCIGPTTYDLSTPHPYNNNMVLQEEIFMPCATHIMVNYSSLSFVETEFDSYKLCKNVDCTSIYGSNPNGVFGSSFYDTYVPGANVFVNFVSDEENSYYGFDLMATASYGMEIPLNVFVYLSF